MNVIFGEFVDLIVPQAPISATPEDNLMALISKIEKKLQRDISVPPTEMTRPVTVDRIFRSDQTEMVRSI